MIIIKIKTGNSAFEGFSYFTETCRILREIARDYLDGSPREEYRDINGNRVADVKEVRGNKKEGKR